MDSRRVLGLLILGAEAYWASVTLAMHWLEPEFDPIRTPVSAYVHGRYGTWMVSHIKRLLRGWKYPREQS